MKREKVRQRKARSRQKLRETARVGDPAARKKIDNTRKYDREYSTKYRLKRKKSTAGNSEDQKAKEKIGQRKKSKRKRSRKSKKIQ